MCGSAARIRLKRPLDIVEGHRERLGAMLAVRRVVSTRERSENDLVSCGGLTFLLASFPFARRERGGARSGLEGEPDELAIARARLRAGCCHRCGNEIEEGLARVASVLCYDCRAATGLIGLS